MNPAESAYLRSPQQQFELSAGQQHWRLGSSAEADLQVMGSGVLPLHAELQRNGILWKLNSLEPAQPASVNGAPSQTVFLKAGDCIGLGDCELVFEPPGAATNSLALSQAQLEARPHWPRLLLLLITALGVGLVVYLLIGS
ncbi:MAG: FHA domain-containing protein [Cellvibrionaceae bacterium]|nr:FHA domain-containing protein [Cellvibrionaceae bacterium]